MATLLIRDLPDEIDERLAETAAAARRSKEKQAMYLIETGLRRKRSHAETMAEAKRIHAMFKGKPTTMKEILEWTETEH